MLTGRTYQVRAVYWYYQAGWMDRRTALFLLRWIRRGQGTLVSLVGAVSAETAKVENPKHGM